MFTKKRDVFLMTKKTANRIKMLIMVNLPSTWLTTVEISYDSFYRKYPIDDLREKEAFQRGGAILTRISQKIRGDRMWSNILSPLFTLYLHSMTGLLSGFFESEPLILGTSSISSTKIKIGIPRIKPQMPRKCSESTRTRNV